MARLFGSIHELEAYQRRARAGKPAGVEACAAMARLYSPESDVLKATLGTLSVHPRVAWAARINSGAFEVEGRYIESAFRGCSDVLGMLKGGRLLAVECKSTRGALSADQEAFGAAVAGNGGLFVVARSIDDVMAAIAAAT